MQEIVIASAPTVARVGRRSGVAVLKFVPWILLAVTVGGFAAPGNDMTGSGAGSLAQQRFRDIVPPLLDDAYALAKWLSHSAADAEDIVQDAALRALKALESAAVERPRPWFLAIVRNTAMTWLARNRPSALHYAGDLADLEAIDPRLGEDGPPDPEQTLIALEDGIRLREAMGRLPPPLLETLVMRDVNGLSYREIADATEAPIGTVMSRLARARAAIVKAMRTEP